ncbi:hypothetical protein DPQ33_09515 [Oceanidesulfovibrio indonesiensis]|uniref:YcaO domain-containing protein n=1 Tax=Oceanidesulfovibrio indonesiensis TaxID=54767 RepID=A0A7M3MFG2_9BACT|nr:YcaO-like family protein [Oceanidesulfovibrio indonesiensis]TVM17399.1 hypothetical protein DPQ33_09515 [Oceanidesulfovibrio indonesiensis]
MIRIAPCPKGYTRDQDKTNPPTETVARVKKIMAAKGRDILAETRRIDTGRLDIPVYLSICGEAAKRVMPTRKQMGKGASPEQAEASALMELVERFSFFSFWEDADFKALTYSEAMEEAEDRGLPPVMPVSEILASVHENLPEEDALRVLDTMRWLFYPATALGEDRETLAPLDWFKVLGEFNGTCAGNATAESLLQGGCELIERHVCALWDRDHRETPTIRHESLQDPVLVQLLRKFTDRSIQVVLKDFTMDMPAPTVAAAAYDPNTFPDRSEIVFTAGTAASPVKAAIRALTEVAQLAGDFETGSVYEASGLPKLESPEEFEALAKGPQVDLDSLPSIEDGDIADELSALCQGLKAKGLTYYAVDMTRPELELPAHYGFVPGLDFRERDIHPSIGLFVGRLLAEVANPEDAERGLATIAEVYGEDAFFMPFFRGMLSLRQGQLLAAEQWFQEAEPIQPDDDKKALAAFYIGYVKTLMEDWEGSIPCLDRAIALSKEVKEYFNLRGVAKFKRAMYDEAACDFEAVLGLDKGSAMDIANLGVCNRHLGNPDKAMELLSAALELDPSLEYARKHLDELNADQ